MSSREGGDTLAFSATSTAGVPEATGVVAPDAAAAFQRFAVPEPQKSATDETAPWRMRRGWLVRRMLLAADLLALAAAFAVVEAFFHRAQLVGQIGIGVETIIFLALLPVWVLAAKLYGLYDRDEESATHSTADEVVSVFHLVTVGVWLFYASSWLVGLSNPDQAKLATFWFLALLFVVAARSAARTLARRQSAYVQNALIVGAGEVGQLIGRKLLQHPEYRINLLGFIDAEPRAKRRVDSSRVEGLPLVGLPPSRISRSSRLLKRSFDILGSATLLALCAPTMLLIAFLIRRDSHGPVFFRQARLGMDLHEFTLLKFRTMQEGTDEAPHRDYIKQIMKSDALPGSNNLYKLERHDSITRVGRWLRKTSLDELPQLINVLRGEMSLVGPRPLIPYELELFSPHQFERFLVPAGLTGLWQVEARAHSTFGEALDLDVAYARGWSFGLDLRLLLRTPLVIFRNRDTG